MVTITDKEFMQLVQYIQNSYGIHLKEQEKKFVIGILHNVLIENNCRSFIEYFNILELDNTVKLVEKLINKIT